MGLYGPFTATVNTVQQCNISADAQGVYIVNTSRYDLAVAFQAGQPVNTTNFGGPPWYVVVPAGDRMGVQIPLAVYGASGFPGYVWVLPVDGTTSYATTGTTSNNDNFYLESFADVAQMPADYASAQFSNAASQQRVVTVPTIAHSVIYGLKPVTAASQNGTDSTALYTFSAPLVTPQTITAYLYQAILIAAKYRLLELALRLGALDNSNALITTSTAFSDLPLSASFPQTIGMTAMQFACPINTKTVVLAWTSGTLVRGNTAAVNAGFFVSASLDIDATGQTPPPAIGNGAATPTGVLY